MALFSLTDISFSEPEIRIPDKLMLGTTRYPIDIGDTDKGHYMLFSIYVNDLTDQQYPCVTINKNSTGTGLTEQLIDPFVAGGKKALGSAATAATQYSSTLANAGNSIKNSLNNILQNKTVQTVLGTTQQGVNTIGKFFNQLDVGNLTGARVATKTTRINDVICLYMPNTLAFTHSHGYSEIKRGGDNLTNLATGASFMKDYINGSLDVKNAMSTFLSIPALQNVIGGIAGQGTTQAIITRNFGAVNPRIEYIYTSPVLQTYQFDYVFYPRSEKEAQSVLEIIRLFNFHSAPELRSATKNTFLVPPSEFKIEFYYNGQVNPNIRPIKKNCVLTSISTDYAPNGFKTYETNDGRLDTRIGGTGMPVAIRMTLQFKELEFYEKKDFSNSVNKIVEMNRDGVD